MTPRAAERLARQVAQSMEAAERGQVPLHSAIDAVRAAGAVAGAGAVVPTVRAYLEGLPDTASPKTERGKRRAVAVFIEYLGGAAERRLDMVTPAQCRGFVRWALERVSKGTVGRYKSYLGWAFRRAVEVDDYLQKNPMAGVNLGVEAASVNPGKGQDKQKRMPFTLAEIRHMIDHFPAPWGDMVAVSWQLAGLRLSDVCLLRWSAIDWARGVITLVEKKTGKERQLPMVPRLQERLENLRQQTESEEEYVFPTMARYYLGGCPGWVSTQFTALLRAHGMIAPADNAPLVGRRHAMAEKSFHSIRHAAVSYLRSRVDFSADVIRDTVGHASEQVERGYYTGNLAQRGQVCRALSAGLSDLAKLQSAPAYGEHIA